MSVIKKCARFLFLPLNLLNKCIPKSPNTMFFYSNLGFRDNVKSLYDYCVEKGLNSRFKIIVATDEYKNFVKNAPKNVRFVSTIRGIFSFFVCKNCFYSFGKYPIKPARDQIVVNLWHGMPLKSIGRLEKGHQNDDQNFFTHLIATSPFFAEIMAKAFGACEKQMLISSQPRCDEMFKDAPKPKAFEDYKKVVFWLPTFLSSKRLGQTDGVYEKISPFDTCFLNQINSALYKTKTLLVIKPHPMDDASLPKQDLSNILFVNDGELLKKGYSLYSALRFADALVTDFSSIYIDYLLLDRPIAFAGPDPEQYRQNRGFVTDDFLNLMPGKHIHSTEEFKNFIIAVANGQDEFCDMRRECNERFNTFVGGGCERILKELNICKTEELK